MMKKLFYCLLLFAAVGCRAQQQIQPLFTNLFDVIPGAYLKDLNNDLDPYVGTYSTTYQNRIITLFITKKIYQFNDFPQRNHHKDLLTVKYIIKDSSDSILQDTQNFNLSTNEMQSVTYIPQIQSLGFSYSGTNCQIGEGLIFMKKVSPNQISWTYKPQTTVIDDVSCPPSLDRKVYLPATENLIFTKQ